jgi:hypothetical protein
MVKEHLLNEKEFWLAYPVASYAKTEPDYYQGSHNECNWRGPTWAPTNYMIFQGLMRYGFTEEAKTLSDRLLEMAVEKNPVLREYYDAETGLGLGQTTTSCGRRCSLTSSSFRNCGAIRMLSVPAPPASRAARTSPW